MDTLLQDARYAVRTLRKNPVFTLVAVSVLALAIGAAVSVFSVVNAVLLRPLPFRDADQLVVVWNRFPQPGMERVTLSPAELSDVEGTSGAFQGWGALSYRERNLTGSGDPEHLPALDVTPGLFRLLGVSPALGRTFTDEEARGEGGRVAVLGHGLWARRFGSDPGVVGRTVVLDGEPYTVVGVMPREFEIPNPSGFLLPHAPEIWTPLAAGPLAGLSRGDKFLRVVGRMRPGTTPERARAEIDVLARGLRTRFPDSYPEGWGLDLLSLREQTVGAVRPALVLLMAVVGMVLLIACVNVSNLLLAQTVGRRREIAVRSAIGATRGRLVRQLLTESLLLVGIGGAAGLLLAVWGVEALAALPVDTVPRLGEVAVDGRVLAFALLSTLATGLFMGVFPAVQTTAGAVYAGLREGMRTTGEGRRLRGVLVVGQVALTLVVLAGTGLMLNSFFRLTGGDPGFDRAGVVTMELTLPDARYPDPAAQARLYTRVLERVRELPGVRDAATVNPLPLSGNLWEAGFVVEGKPTLPDGQTPTAEFASVSPDYFRAMRIPLLRGRPFGAGDRTGGPRVVIVDQALARAFWPGADPVGARIHLAGTPDTAWATVVGVAGQVASVGLDAPERPHVYLPYTQRSRTSSHLVVRAAGDPLALVPALRAAVHEVDPDLPLGGIRTMDRVFADSVAGRRLVTLLLSGFGGAALLLASLGLYGLVAYAVKDRTREIGVRIALGARRADVLRLVLREGLALALAGIGIGALLALPLAGTLSTLLYGIEATDPATLSAVALLLTMVALLASWLPARRATRVDPMIALRSE